MQVFGPVPKPIELRLMLVCQPIIWLVVQLRFRLRFLLFFQQRFYQLIQKPSEPGL